MTNHLNLKREPVIGECARIERHDAMMFIGGFDPPSKIVNSKKPTSFLACLHPADDFEELKKRLGTIDYTPPSPILRSSTEAT